MNENDSILKQNKHFIWFGARRRVYGIWNRISLLETRTCVSEAIKC